MELQVRLLKKNGMMCHMTQLMQMLEPTDLNGIEKSLEKQIAEWILR